MAALEQVAKETLCLELRDYATSGLPVDDNNTARPGLEHHDQISDSCKLAGSFGGRPDSI
jgi:hypothetical protein